MTEKIILGIDEVGRGPWAGPLVVGAVILGPEFKNLPEYERLTDSKKLTAGKRETLNELILQHAAATGLGWVAASEIDHYGLGPALKLAARRAVKPILAQISKNIKTAQETVTSESATPGDATLAAGSDAAPTIPIAASPSSAKLLKFDEILIDGTINLLVDTPLADKVTLLPKADFLIKEVSAASIIAKVARDRYMTDLAEQYPGYGFESHVGYGTAAHKSALLELGPCPEHRKSFRPIAALLAQLPSATPEKSTTPTTPVAEPEAAPAQTATSTTTPTRTSTKPKRPSATASGQKAEQVVADYLKTEQNHTIVARNFKTKTYEIDLISISGDTSDDETANNTSITDVTDKAPSSANNTGYIYFTEVKYRKTSSRGTPLDQITPKKHQQIQFAADAFLADHPEYQNLQPHLAAASVQGPDFQLKDWFILSE